MIDYCDTPAGIARLDLIRKLSYFIVERDEIRQKKEAGLEGPWTEDDILSTYRFCNIRRKHDRVSKWVIDNIITPNEDSDNLWFMLCCARWINWPPTIQELMALDLWPVKSFDPIRFGRVIDSRVARGDKTWTGAYMITARQIEPGQGKGEFIAERMLLPLLQSKLGPYLNSSNASSRKAEDVYEILRGHYGWGSFMAGQVIADMSYCRLLGQATDLQVFAVPGPGSMRGLNRIFERPLDQNIPRERFVDELMTIRYETEKLTGKVPDMTLHDWQNVMCEYDKFLRAVNGGRPRTNYTPETSF